MTKVIFIRPKPLYYNPLVRYKAKLKKNDIHVTMETDFSNVKKLSKYDYIILSNMSYKNSFDLDYIKKISCLGNKLFWFEETDSTGSTNFEVLPYVTKYLKKQLLKDRKLYFTKFYRDRIFTDFYHTNFGVCDDDPFYTATIPEIEFIDKICLSWNLVYSDYINYNRLIRASIRRFPFIMNFTSTKSFSSIDFYEKRIDVFCRIHFKKYANSVGYQRRKVIELLNIIKNNELNLAFDGVVNQKKYQNEISHSKVVLSPFGWGEICYRDFEAFLYKACLVKFDVSHLITWPDILKPNETYIPLKWDFSDFVEKINLTISDNVLLMKIAEQGHAAFNKYLGLSGAHKFVDHFTDLLSV